MLDLNIKIVNNIGILKNKFDEINESLKTIIIIYNKPFCEIFKKLSIKILNHLFY